MLSTAYCEIRSCANDDRGVANSDRRLITCPGRVKRPAQSRVARQLLHSLLQRDQLSSPSMHLVQEPDGRPKLYCDNRPSAIAISLSHSRRIAACAMTDLGSIGIDVEFCADRPVEELAAIAFGPEEQHAVARGGLRAFYRIWTMREALVMASRTAAARMTDDCDYFACPPTSGGWCTVLDNQPWVFWSGFLSGNYAFAVALAPQSSTSFPDSLAFEVEQFSFTTLMPG